MSTTSVHPPATSRLDVRVPVELAEALRDLAQRNDRSIGAEAKRALRGHLAREGHRHVGEDG